jgi:hypothetical protein
MPTCPRCRGQLLRVHRRLVDRVSSWFTPVRRYRCLSFRCQWEGNARRWPHVTDPGEHESATDSLSGLGSDADGRDRVASVTFVVCMVLSVIGAGFILVSTGVEWFASKSADQYLSNEGTWHTQPTIAPKAEAGK